jgi:hypothetical protein
MSVAQPVAVAPLECRACRKALPSPAPLKCPECKEYQGECRNCGQGVPRDARRCNGCKAFLTGPECWSCGAPVPMKARCGVCNSVQGAIRRWFPDSQIALALLVSLISVLGATLPRIAGAWSYGSETRVRLIGTEKVKQQENGIEVETNAIRIAASNSGTGYAAVVRKAEISFDAALEIEPAELDVANPEDTLVLAEKTSIVKWVRGEGLSRARKSKTRDEILRLLPEKNVTVTVWVEETRPFRKPRLEKRTDSVPGAQLYDFINEHTP